MTVELRESPSGHLAEACAEASVPGVVTLREIPFLPQAEVRGPDLARTDDALWLGPGWYLVVGRVPAGAVDTSAARTTLELAGPYARDVLAHGCRLDLHPRVFPPGAAARTNVAKATVVLHRYGDAYRLYVGSSSADYLTRWLLDAMTPYVSAAAAEGPRRCSFRRPGTGRPG